MIKDSITKRKVLSFILAFALLIGFIPMNLVKAEGEMNYAEDEKKIKDFSEKERYRSTQMEQGNGPVYESTNTESIDFKDGYRYSTLEPNASIPDKRKWGFEIEFDKEKGQRTYTSFSFTNSGLMGAYLNAGNVPAKSPDDGALGDSFKTPNYEATTEIIIVASRQQRNLNAIATEKDLEHINSINNNNTIMAWKGHYSKDNTTAPFATQGESATFSFTVNPWPNENDKLSLIKLNGSHNKKEFVQGQTITTNISVENLDKNARERLVGQVYHPVTGEIVPGAKAYINENDKVVVEIPKGVIDENGNLNKDSIFYKDPNYKALTNLEVKFFARPRTEAEFRAISEEANYGEDGYTQTGAGTTTINHKGENVEIDLQGIDRYDHYNLIGKFNINLDDTRYYDQGFIDENKDDTQKHTSSKVKPGEEFTVELYVPEEKKDKDVFPNQKTPEQMEAAKDANQAVGTIDWQFINKINEGKKPEDQWKLEYDESTLPTTFKITPPKSAKSGEFVAVPLTYTYTNGSTDVHWFHFVVQESSNNRPEYLVQVDYPAIEQKSTPEVPQDDKKLSPVSYSLPEGTEFKDDHDNLWTVSINEETGEVTAKPQDATQFDGGEKLQVPVIAHYKDEDEPEKVITEETIAEFIIRERANMTPRYNAQAGKAGDELSSEVILNEEDKFNRRPTKFTLDSDTYTDDKGNTWNVTIDENTGKVTATVPNPEEGKTIDGALLNVPVIAHYYEADGDVEVATREVEVQFVSYGTNGTFDKIEEIPFETKVEKNPDLKKGEIKVITEGKKGSKKVTYTIKDSVIDDALTKEVIIDEAEDRLIHVGEGVNDGTHKIEEKVEVPFETEVQFDDSLKPGEQKVTQEGIPGEKTRTTTLTIEDGKVTKTEEGEYTETKAPTNKIIKVGRNTEGKVEHKEELPFEYKVEYVDDLKKGEYRIVKPGKVGTKTTTWTIKNSEISGEPTVEIVEAEDALIQVGKGTNDGTHEIVEKKALDYKTVIEYDENLDAGQQEVVKEGNPGEQERTNTLVIKDGQVTETKEGEFKTTKEATDRVVKIGTKPVTKTVEKPFNTEYQYDENLEAGKTEEVTPGKNGKVIITTTYNKETGKIETAETEEPAQNRVVKIGGKTNGTEKITEEIPFEVEVRKDPSLKKGEWKYATDDEGNELRGEKGEQEKTLTIVNSKVTEISEPTITKKPKKAVVLVGEGTNDGTHKIEEKVEVPFETEIQFDDSLAPGETKEVQKGEPGEKTRTNILTIEDGKVTKTEFGEFTETKAPTKRIIKVGRNTEGKVEHKEEIPFGYKVEEVEDLKKGEYRIVKPGKVGTKTTTWTIKNSQIDGEPKEEIVPAEDALIQIGKGTNDGTHEIKEKKEIPFETIIEYDDSLEPGEEKVVQEGTPGEQERTNTLVIKDGKVVETKEGEFKTTKEAVNKIVKVGRKPSEGETTKTIEREIPYETKVIYDENLEAGFQKIENEGKPGKEEVTITQKVKDSKPVGEATETTKTITEKEDRIVRVGVKPVVKEVELGNNTEYRHNPELKAGEEKVIEEGSKGSVKYITTFNKETGKLEVTEERVEPKNKIVEYGTKTEGEFKYESEQAYNVIIRENPDLDAGTHNVVQEGIAGKTETTVKVVNSEEVSRETKTITEKQDMIIEIGTKNVCEIPPIDPENPDKPEEPKDPEKPGEEDPKDPEKPGEEDPKDPDKPVEEDPKDPNKPGEEDSKDPDKPVEEDPKDPNKPGDNDSENPDKPGNNDPNKPGTPGSNDPKDPNKPGIVPNIPGSSNEGNTPSDKKPENNKANKNNTSYPNTGDKGVMYLGGFALVALIAFLFISKSKNKDEE